VTLNTPITDDLTVEAVWADAPAKPYHTVTFNKDDGTGVFEKRIAVPTKPEPKTDAGQNLTSYKDVSGEESGEETPAEYSGYTIQEKDYAGIAIEQNKGELIPAFTREHYTSGGWADINGAAATISNGHAAIFDKGDTQLYMQWKPNTFTVEFDTNVTGEWSVFEDNQLLSTPNSLTAVNEPSSVEGGLAKAGKQLPVIEVVMTDTDSELYKFDGWYDEAVGGNKISASTPLYPKGESGSVTLYAHWLENGASVWNFNSIGKVQTWTAPADGTYSVELYGAAGGNNTYGGKGGYISGDITLKKYAALYIYVGGMGGNASGGGSKIGGTGGWNGGGKGGGTGGGMAGKGGGGGTDIRLKKASGADTVWNDESSLASRIIVAGGGGGNTLLNNINEEGVWTLGGNGGLGKAAGGAGVPHTAFYKNNYSTPTNGGSLESGGVAGVAPNTGVSNPNADGKSGSFGYGGNGGDSGHGRAGGGGGGGHWGGAGGIAIYHKADNPKGSAANPAGTGGYPGGGGSSWAAGESVKDAHDGLFFTNIGPDSSDGGGTREGNGEVKIKLKPAKSQDPGA
jgi:uncharacterized repeat protein (TIGR02543 family)